MPEALRDRYFERQDQRLLFRKDLRRSVVSGRNDLMEDAPISRIDLLACRNTLMSFDAPTQAKILARFHFALNDDSVLFLGRAETLMTHNTLFVPLDLRRRVFTKAPRFAGRTATPLPLRVGAFGGASGDGVSRLLGDVAIDVATVPQLVVDRGGRLAIANDRALFQIGEGEIGRPLQDLELSYRPFELRSAIDQAYVDLRGVTRRGAVAVAERRDAVVRHRDRAARRADRRAGGGERVVRRGPRHKQLQQQVEESQAELEAAYQELETTNEELHSTVEELDRVPRASWTARLPPVVGSADEPAGRVTATCRTTTAVGLVPGPRLESARRHSATARARYASARSPSVVARSRARRAIDRAP